MDRARSPSGVSLRSPPTQSQRIMGWLSSPKRSTRLFSVSCGSGVAIATSGVLVLRMARSCGANGCMKHLQNERSAVTPLSEHPRSVADTQKYRQAALLARFRTRQDISKNVYRRYQKNVFFARKK